MLALGLILQLDHLFAVQQSGLIPKELKRRSFLLVKIIPNLRCKSWSESNYLLQLTPC